MSVRDPSTEFIPDSVPGPWVTLEEPGMTAEEDDEDRATLDEDSSEGRVAEPPSSPQAAKKNAAQTEAVKVNFFILCIITKNDRLESYCL